MNPDLILIGDIHIGDLHPECRTDNYLDALGAKLDWIESTYPGIPKLQAGDLFDHWKQPPEIITWALRHLPQPLYGVMGQHDLPNHTLELKEKSAWRTIEEAGRIRDIVYCGRYVGTWLQGFSWGQGLPKSHHPEYNKTIALTHTTTWMNPIMPGQQAGHASDFLKSHHWDLILTGDNHQTFDVTWEGRTLINPGSLMRMRADQIDHRPCIYELYLDCDPCQFKKVYVPCQAGVVVRSHIEKEQAHEQRVSAFVERLGSGDMEVGLSFEDNMKSHLETHPPRPAVAQIVQECME